MKTVHSRRGLFGLVIHYDESGRVIGKSSRGLFGSVHHYDTHGRLVGTSRPGLFGGHVAV